MFVHTNREEMDIYPQTIVGWVEWMSCSQPDAWCNQLKLKRQEYGQVTVILAADIIPISVWYMKHKISTVSKRSIKF